MKNYGWVGTGCLWPSMLVVGNSQNTEDSLWLGMFVCDQIRAELGMVEGNRVWLVVRNVCK